jgi:hypothetical protein
VPGPRRDSLSGCPAKRSERARAETLDQLQAFPSQTKIFGLITQEMYKPGPDKARSR